MPSIARPADSGNPAARREMLAMDALPERLRTALNYSYARHFAVELMEKLDQGMTEEEVYQMILRTDAAMVKHG